MDEVDEQAIAAFDNYLGTLAGDAQAILDVVNDTAQPEELRRVLAGALNYLFKSLDLIDDGIEGLGFLDDAFVLRMACGQAAQQGELPETLVPLAQDAELVVGFLGEVSARLYGYVLSLTELSVRGRSVEAIVQDEGVRGELTADVVSWAARYQKPQFVLDERGLIKLRSFMNAKLPS